MSARHVQLPERNPGSNSLVVIRVWSAYRGVAKKCRPDFLIRLATGKMLVLEIKGQDTQQNKTKREFLAEWVKSVNAHSRFGRWACDVSFDPSDLPELLEKHRIRSV